MRAIPRRLTLSLLLALLSCAPALAQQTRMQLLTPDVGWVSGTDVLYWTTDRGGHWTNIAPPMSLPREKIADIFFKDTTHGWALLSTDENEKDQPEARFEVASTTDSGASWSATAIETGPGWPARPLLLPQGKIFFLDSAHGWLGLGYSGGMSRGSLLLATGDGGATWIRRAMAPAGPIRFVTLQDGWIAGGENSHELYTTADGGNTWREISLQAAAEGGPSVCGVDGLPAFTDAKHGSILGHCRVGELVEEALFATDDGGKSWRVLKSFPLPPDWRGDFPVASAGSTWLVATQDRSALTLRQTDANGMRTKAAKTDPQSPGVVGISFVTPEEGWVLTNRLLATPDGGTTWKDISPCPLARFGRAPSPQAARRLAKRQAAP